MRPRLPWHRALVGLALLLAINACTDDPEPQPDVPSDGWIDAVRFEDVASDVGLEFRHGAFRWSTGPDVVPMMGSGLCWLDVDNDDWLDLFVVNGFARHEAGRWEDEGGLPRSALFRNEQGRFADVSSSSGADLAIRGQGCVAADFDLDGNTDLFVTADGANALLWNQGDGTFAEGAEAAGVEAFGWHTGAAVADVDGNGWPDVYVSGYANVAVPIPEAVGGFPRTYFPERDLLFLNDGAADDGAVTFREVGIDAGLEVVNLEYGLGANFADFDADGDLDLYVANDTNPNRLYATVPWPGGVAADPAGIGFRFEEIAGPAGLADPNAGMGVAVGDLDLTGSEDLLVTNARGQGHAVYLAGAGGDDPPRFEDVRSAIGVDVSAATGWGAELVDVDRDTDLDVLIVNGAIPVTDLAADAEVPTLWVNRAAQGEPGSFALDGAGLDEVGPLLARGSAAADFDNDGDLDVAINVIGGDLVLLRSSGAAGHWLTVRPDHFAPGAVVTAVLGDGRTLTRRVLAGSSYLSSEDPRAHFGLGTFDVVEEVRVRWPDGGETVLTDVEADQIVDVSPP